MSASRLRRVSWFSGKCLVKNGSRKEKFLTNPGVYGIKWKLQWATLILYHFQLQRWFSHKVQNVWSHHLHRRKKTMWAMIWQNKVTFTYFVCCMSFVDRWCHMKPQATLILYHQRWGSIYVCQMCTESPKLEKGMNALWSFIANSSDQIYLAQFSLLCMYFTSMSYFLCKYIFMLEMLKFLEFGGEKSVNCKNDSSRRLWTSFEPKGKY